MTNVPSPSSFVQRVLRHPLLHFSIIGALLYLAAGSLEPARPDELFVTSNDLATMRADWLRATGRKPDEREMDRLIQLFVDENLLVREARSLGWDRDDAVVQQRLIRNLRFLGESADGRPTSEMSDSELLAMAYEMEMEMTDIVVHRRLLERMKLAIGARVRSREPLDSELADHLARHPNDFERPARLRLSHVFVSRDLRGAALHDDALALREKLRKQSVPPDQASQHGDSLLLGADLPLWSLRQIAERLGPDFADALEGLPVGEWSGPVPSSYGVHLVWLHERVPAQAPSVEQARRELRAAVLYEREAAALRATQEALRVDVVVRVEGREQVDDGDEGRVE